MLNTDMHKVVEPGAFEIMVGPNSEQTTTAILNVIGSNGETGIAPPPPPPAGSESGVVSNFDDLKVSSQLRGMDGHLRRAGGRQIHGFDAACRKAEPTGSKGALKVTGEIVPRAGFAWAGVLFYPGSSPEDSVESFK